MVNIKKGLNMLIKITFNFIFMHTPSNSTHYVIFGQIKQLKEDLPRVWLLLYDLYLRTFSKRKPELLALKDKLFKESEMLCKFLSARRKDEYFHQGKLRMEHEKFK